MSKPSEGKLWHPLRRVLSTLQIFIFLKAIQAPINVSTSASMIQGGQRRGLVPIVVSDDRWPIGLARNNINPSG